MKAGSLPPPGQRAVSEQSVPVPKISPIGDTSSGTQEAITWPSSCEYLGMETAEHAHVFCFFPPS